MKIVTGIAIALASMYITYRDYNRQVSKLKYQLGRRYINRNRYDVKMKEAKYWRNLGYVADGITLVCAILSIPKVSLTARIGANVVNVLGFAKGMVISRTLLVYDLVSALNHNALSVLISKEVYSAFTKL